MMIEFTDLPPAAFAKLDTGDDADFYLPPRLVTHLDEAAVRALSAYYEAIIPANAALLDLMSSWVSHLPEDLVTREVVGHGMNGRELAANTRLDRWFVQDLNRTPTLPLADQAFDTVLCCVGVQYLQRPIEVFSDVRRTLRPGAAFVVSFSNRCFPTKAVAIWRALDMSQHAALVRLYLERAGFTDIAATVIADGREGDPLITVTGRA